MLTRRSLLAGTAALPVCAAIPLIPIVDTHIHIYDTNRAQGVPWPPASERVLYKPHLASNFRTAIGSSGVTGAVIVEASPWLADNDWILERASEDKLFLCVVGHLDPASASFSSDLTRLSANPKFRGIRISGSSLKEEFYPKLEQLATAGLSLDVLTGPDQLPKVAALAARLPDLRIVVNHLPMYPSPSAELKLLAGAPGIFIKVSAVLRKDHEGRVPDSVVFYRDVLDELWDTFGASRLVYGSNWPVSNRLSDYGTQLRVVGEYFRSKGSTPARQYFSENAARLYRWPGVSY
ncbi:MAG: amidohydrolase family protein [Bryobacteraceae bacterium]|nr:amidohydrolase family protein [Bryobacteraceae bacterium]